MYLSIMIIVLLFYFPASQMWCLSRLLPLIIGQLVPEDDDHWKNFLLLLRITDFVFSPVLSRTSAMYLVYLIDDYLQTFVELYPHCKIIPKQHYMVHIPQWIVRYIQWYYYNYDLYINLNTSWMWPNDQILVHAF